MANLPDTSAGALGSGPEEASEAPGSTTDLVRRRWRLVVLGVAVLLVFWLARGIVGPFVVAAVLAYAFSPVVTSVENRTGAPRALVIAVGYALVLGAVGVLAVLAAERAGSELSELSSGGQDPIASALRRLFGDTITVAGQQLVVSDLAAQIRKSLLGLIQSPTDAVQVATRAVDVALQAILTLIVTFYFLLDGRRFGEFALRFLDRSQRADALRISHRIHVVLGRWLRGQLFLIALISTVIYVILGPILHVPYALALAVLTGVLEIIPLVGPIIAASLAVTVAYAAHGTDTALVVLVVYFVVRQIEDQVIMPLVIGRAVHLHPVITIFAVLVGLSAWGIFGGLMGVPVAAALNVTLHELFPEETRYQPEADYRRGARPGSRLRPRWRGHWGAEPVSPIGSGPSGVVASGVSPTPGPDQSGGGPAGNS